MEKKLINGHYQFIFSEEDKKTIHDLFVNQGYSQRKLMKVFGCTQKPMSRILDEMGLDHRRGNLTAFNYNFLEEIYDPVEEQRVLDCIQNIPSKKQKYSVNENYFNDIRNPEVIYTIGFLYADGCNSNCRGISMCLEEQDGYVLERINDNIRNEKPVIFLDKTNKHDFGYTYKNQYALQIYNRKIAETLNILGVTPRKSLTLSFPKWLHPTLYSHFIRGYFDGDGSICKRLLNNNLERYVLTITSTEQFCKALVDISAQYINIKGHIYDASNHNGITKVFSLSGPLVTKKFLDWIYQDSTIYLERKYKRYVDYYNINKSLSA